MFLNSTCAQPKNKPSTPMVNLMSSLDKEIEEYYNGAISEVFDGVVKSSEE